MGRYHKKLDRKYFHKSIYIRKWEETFNVKIKDCPLQYDIVFDTFNTFIMLNNFLFSTNYIPQKEKVNKILDLLNNFLTQYKNKIQKSYDSQCIVFYENFEIIVYELQEMKDLYINNGKKYNLHSIEEAVEEYMALLDIIRFDLLVDSKNMHYSKAPNDKLPKTINCKLVNDIEVHKDNLYFDESKMTEASNQFIEEYLTKYGIDLNKDIEQKYNIFDIHIFIKDLNNFIVEMILHTDIKKYKLYLEIFSEFMNRDFSCIEDIYYKNLIKRIDKICLLLCDAKLKEAYDKVQEIIEENKKWYERIS